MQHNDLRILCVEDDHDVGHIVRLALALDTAMEIRIVADEAGALSAVAGGFDPDVLLLNDGTRTDLPARMGVACGIEPPPVIFLTTDVRVSNLTRLKAAAAGVIAKPFDPLNLAATVRSLIG
ncbi:hypothetical protein [Sphingomonas sp. 1P08PE]|uniref:hypothetical protein n=1 Tax=Sphingomonas sp. 1P08PE TaxID=554122 RepID=UPI00399F8CBC